VVVQLVYFLLVLISVYFLSCYVLHLGCVFFLCFAFLPVCLVVRAEMVLNSSLPSVVMI
jgi:hypothetical protein